HGADVPAAQARDLVEGPGPEDFWGRADALSDPGGIVPVALEDALAALLGGELPQGRGGPAVVEPPDFVEPLAAAPPIDLCRRGCRCRRCRRRERHPEGAEERPLAEDHHVPPNRQRRSLQARVATEVEET